MAENFKILHESLSQYKFYWYSAISIFGLDSGVHDNYIDNTIKVFNNALENYKKNWSEKKFAEATPIRNEILNRDDFFNEGYLYSYKTYNPSLMLKINSKEVLANPNKYKDLIIRLLFFTIYNVDSVIGEWGKNSFEDVILPTFASFDYFSNLSATPDYINASEDGKITLIYNHIGYFFDELSSKIDNIFEDLKIYTEKPFTLSDHYTLSKYNFFYDSTDTTNSSYTIIKKLVNLFKSNAIKFKSLVSETNLEDFRATYRDKIISSEKIFSEFLPTDNTNDTSINSLAIRILWHSFNDLNHLFVLMTFSKFDCYNTVISGALDEAEKIQQIRSDLLNNEGMFFDEFKAAINDFFDSLEPKTENEYYIYLDNTIDKRFVFYTKQELSPDYFDEEVNFYNFLSSEYKKAKQEYVNKKINEYKKTGQDPIGWDEILDSIGYDYRRNIMFSGTTSNNIDPKFGGYEALSSKYIYYIYFAPINNATRPERNASYIKNFLTTLTIAIEDGKELTEYFWDAYQELFKEIQRDFWDAYLKAKEINKTETEILNRYSESLITLLPYKFDKKFEINIPKDRNYEYFDRLLNTWESRVLQYNALLISQKENSFPAKFRKDSMLKTIENEKEINSGIIYDKYFNNIDTMEFIVAKLAFFYIFLINNESIENYPKLTERIKNSDSSLEKIYTYSPRESDSIKKSLIAYKINLNGTNYTVKELFKAFLEEANRILSEIEKEASVARTAIEAAAIAVEERNKYESFLKNIKSSLSFEKDYFYLKDLMGKETIPVSPSVDIEFRTYTEEGKEIWVSVSRRSSNKQKNLQNGLYHENYFDRMTFSDTGGKKEINISLKSIDDINLERIILNSLLTPVDKFNETIKSNNSSEESVDTIVSTSNFRISNFRIRFGYNDIPYDANSAIDEKEITSPIFSSRIINDKPVLKTPWLYFLINKLDTNFTSEEVMFDIGGLNVGSYMLDEFRIYSSVSLDSATQITAEQAVGAIAKALFESSDGTICILGDEPNTIVSEYNSTSAKLVNRKIIISGNEANKEYSLQKSDFDFDPFYIQLSADGITKQIFTKSFNSEKQEDEDGEETIPTARKILDDLVNFLPTKLYGVPKIDEEGRKFAFKVPKDKQHIIKDFAKELKMSYEIVECESELYNLNSSSTDNKYGKKRRTFIRLYYKGPISRSTEREEKTRFYQYRGGKNSLVKSLRIENPINFQKIYGVVGAFQANKNALVYASRISTSLMSSGSFIGDKKKVNLENFKGAFFVPKNDIKIADTLSYDNRTDNPESLSKDESVSVSLNKISSIANDLSRYVYEGEMEIMGDPYYIFDDDLEPWRNMIYLKVNRYENIKNENLVDKEDYYSGLYIIKKINHEISSNGEFTTRLGIMKLTMAESE